MSRDLKERAKSLCTLSEASSGEINVAVIKHSVEDADELDEDDVAFYTIGTSTSISQLISRHCNDPQEGFAPELSILDSTAEVSPHHKVSRFVDLAHHGLLVFQETAEATDHLDDDPPHAPEDTEMWSIFANQFIVDNAQQDGFTSLRKEITEKWKELSSDDLEELAHHQTELVHILHSEVAFRAFFIFYHEQRSILVASNKKGINMRACLKSTCKNWRKLDKHDKKKRMIEAQDHLVEFPVPKPPAGLRADLMLEPGREDFLGLQLDPSDFKIMERQTLEQLLSDSDTLMAKIHSALGSDRANDHLGWLGSVKRALKLENRFCVKIGIMGATGSGKSSLINAVLDEIKLVLTSCWRACTAIPTEISYNRDDDSEYRAVINYMTKVEWEAELKVLFVDLEDTTDEEVSDSEDIKSQAQIAREKVSCIYPKLNVNRISKISIEKLLRHKNVIGLLGQSQVFRADTAEQLQEQISNIVDSKDGENSGLAEHDRRIALWPIIRNTQLFTKSPLLRDGVTLVDLPGVHDNNRARAAIAEKYSLECSHSFIVAPSTRAVNDRSANDIFRQRLHQLMRDGMFDKLALISTKSDDIGSAEEVASSLGIKHRIADIEKAMNGSLKQIDNLRDRREQNKKEQREHQQILTESREKSNQYLQLFQQALNSQSASSLSNDGAKRKDPPTDVTGPRAKKNINANAPTSGDVHPADTENIDASCNLSFMDISQKLQDALHRVTELEASGTKLIELGSAMDREIEDTVPNLEDTENEKLQCCIVARNEVTQKTWRADFVTTIREYDAMAATKKSKHETDIERDYDEIENALHVFTVSARAYISFTQPLKSGKVTDGFLFKEQTGVPALQNHIQILSDASYRRYLTSRLSRNQVVLHRIDLWSSERSLCEGLSEEEIESRKQGIRKCSDMLAKDIAKVGTNCTAAINRQMTSLLFNQLSKAEGSARAQAAKVAERWGLPAAEGGLGIHCGTYRAVCRRNGVFVNSRHGEINFNKQLAQPLLWDISVNWEKMFHHVRPDAVEKAERDTIEMLDGYYQYMRSELEQIDPKLCAYQRLSRQLPHMKAMVGEYFMDFVYAIQLAARAANRALNPAIMDHMQPQYEKAARIRGPGSYRMMTSSIEKSVSQLSKTVFKETGDNVKDYLRNAVKDAKATLLKELSTISADLRQDFSSLYSTEDELASASDYGLRQDIAAIFQGHGHIFDKVIDQVKADAECDDATGPEYLSEPDIKLDPDESAIADSVSADDTIMT